MTEGVYLITFRTHGSWVPGDERGWVDRHEHICQPGRAGLAAAARRQMAEPQVSLSPACRDVVDAAIREVCTHRVWWLRALNVRGNHVHAVIQLDTEADRAVGTLKAWSTRRLREAGLWDREQQPWARGGGKRHLHTEASVSAACDYVTNRQ